MTAVLYCGCCRMPQEGLRWHCDGCGGHHVVTDAECPETGTARPGVRMVTMAEPEYRVRPAGTEHGCLPLCGCGHRQGYHDVRRYRCGGRDCPCRRFALAEALV